MTDFVGYNIFFIYLSNYPYFFKLFLKNTTADCFVSKSISHLVINYLFIEWFLGVLLLWWPFQYPFTIIKKNYNSWTGQSVVIHAVIDFGFLIIIKKNCKRSMTQWSFMCSLYLICSVYYWEYFFYLMFL